MKKTLTMLLSAVLLAGMATAVSAFEENVDYVTFGEITSANYPASTSEGWPECKTGTLLKGTIIAGTLDGTNCRDGHTADLAFDGNPTTYFGSFETTARSYVGIILDQAYELTEIRARIADDVPSDNFHGLSVQGSNDGIHWADIIDFRQDATGKTYHIFTPQTVTDPDYLAAGYDARTDESPFWVANGGSYKIYRVWTHACDLSLGDIEFYGVAKEATVLDDEAAAALIATTTWFPGNINYRTVKLSKVDGAVVASPLEIESVDGSLIGTVIGAAGSWNKAYYEYAYDGNNKKAYDPSFRGPENWVGLMMEEPYALTSVKVLPKRGAYANLEGCLIQGSLDGRTWVTLTQLTKEDVPTSQDWVEKTITDTNGYTYFRYVSSILNHGDIADIAFYGAPAAAAANIPEAEKYPVATYEKFLGTLIDTGITTTSADGALTGTIIGYGDLWFLNKANDNGFERIFDGDGETTTGFEKYGALNFVGLKLDAPTVITEVKVLPKGDTWGLRALNGAHIQGSVDGINWVDLVVYNSSDVPAAQEWVTKAVADTTAYTYLRYAPSEHTGSTVAELAFYGTAAAPETTAPVETTAPETEAPVETTAPAETTAPETTAPVETAAPETTAPTTGNEPTAPQTFDFGVIAAVAAVVSAAGYAITKKRK